MRTTIYIDDDLEEKLRDLAHERRASLRRVVNDILRRGLNAPESVRRRQELFQVRPFRSDFRPGVDPLRLNQLVDELEAGNAEDGNAR